MMKYRKIVTATLLVTMLMYASGCKKEKESNVLDNKKQENTTTIFETEQPQTKIDPTEEVQSTKAVKQEYINEKGNCIKDRILVPEGFERVHHKKNSFGYFLENYHLCESGQPVYLYDGSKKGNQNAHVAVFSMDVVDGDLQQCADSVIRMYAEYFYEQKEYQRMQFHFVNGFSCEYEKWRQGMRVKVSGNQTQWYQGAEAETSKESLESYLRMVFSYGSTLSLEQESEIVEIEDIQVGDIFIKGGSPGHVVMVADVCKNQNGEKAFLLAQGYMPAQQFHILKNPLHEENPWYYQSEITYPLDTPEYIFEEGSLRRPAY